MMQPQMHELHGSHLNGQNVSEKGPWEVQTFVLYCTPNSETYLDHVSYPDYILLSKCAETPGLKLT